MSSIIIRRFTCDICGIQADIESGRLYTPGEQAVPSKWKHSHDPEIHHTCPACSEVVGTYLAAHNEHQRQRHVLTKETYAKAHAEYSRLLEPLAQWDKDNPPPPKPWRATAESHRPQP